VRKKYVILSVYSQISLIGFAVLALIYCVFGYKYARFLLPVCGVLILEVAMYLFVSDTLVGDELFTAIFYGGIAIVMYVVLFFVLRLSGFLTGMLGAALFLVYVVFTFNLDLMPYVVPVYLTLCLLGGLLGAAYSRTGVIVVSSLLGGSLATGVILFLIFAGGADAGVREPFVNALIGVMRSKAVIFLVVSAAVVALGVFVQMKFTGFSQVLNAKATIRYEKRKPMRKLVKNKTGK
jgi:hypothetical protein